ncbi:hypothetical protein AB0R11_19900 [Streptomyces fradiae]|jgi:hypothetical protein|uniref:hypothetical protein n=1 Tax=Streptomyces fradiae TaxID=1906 RepID=UPI0034162895
MRGTLACERCVIDYGSNCCTTAGAYVRRRAGDKFVALRMVATDENGSVGGTSSLEEISTRCAGASPCSKAVTYSMI